MAIDPRSLSLPSRFSSFRPGQEEIILSLSSSPKRFTVLQAPTGCGKSVICAAYSRFSSLRSAYLTITKSLQDQIHTQINLPSISGHSNYPCADSTLDDSGDFLDLECSATRDKFSCYYQRAIDNVLLSDLHVNNYAHWVQLAKSSDPMRLGSFHLLICDEAHNIHDRLCDYLAVILKYPVYKKRLDIQVPGSGSTFQKTSNPIDLDFWKTWAESSLRLARARFREAKSSGATRRDLSILTKLGLDLSRLSLELSPDWIISSGPPGTWVKFTPVSASIYSESHLFRSIPRVVLTSATVTLSDAHDLGVPSSDVDLIEIDSLFPVENRPILYYPTSPPVKVDFRLWHDPGKVRLFISRIDEIISARLDRKGIIHANSYDLMRRIVQSSKHRDILIWHETGNESFRQAIREFKSSSSPRVFVSPRIQEGEDFPDELCEYQIIAKLPFLDSRDPMNAARKLRDKSHPDRMVARAIIQMSGRPVRSEKDRAETFIICAHWGHFRNRTGLFPRWFRKAFKRIDRMPKGRTL